MTIVLNNFKRMLGKRSSWVFLILIPVVLNVFIVSLTTRQPQWVIGVEDRDNTALTKEFVENFAGAGKIVQLKDGTDIRSGILGSHYDFAVVFDHGYTDQVIAGKPVRVQTYVAGGTNQIRSLEVQIDSFLNGVQQIGSAAKGDQASFYRGLDSFQGDKFVAEYRNFSTAHAEETKKTVTTLGYLAFAMLMMMTSAAGLLLQDRQRGVFDRVSLTPLRRASYFAQYILSLFAVTAIQLLVVMDVLPKVAHVSYGSTPTQQLGIVALSLSFGLFCVAKSMLVFRVVKTQLMGSAVNTLLDIPMVMLAGALWPRELMPHALQKIGEYMPAYWYLDGSEKVLGNGAISSILPSVGLLAGLSVVLLGITVGIRTERHH